MDTQPTCLTQPTTDRQNDGKTHKWLLWKKLQSVLRLFIIAYCSSVDCLYSTSLWTSPLSLSFASKICLFKICYSGWSLGGKHLHRLLIVIRLGKESERLFISGSIASGKTPFMCREPRVRRSVIIEFPGIKLDDLPLFSLTIINRYTRQRNPNHCNEFRLPCARNGPSTSIL